MPQVLTINAGSSSIRFALFEGGAQLARVMDEKLERIGNQSVEVNVDGLVNKLRAQSAAPDAIGHRVVHGMLHTRPARVTPALLEELKGITPYDPEHLPREIALMEALQKRFPGVPQVACFDTIFHRQMPPVATRLPIPRRYAASGVQRYGFHGLSYTFLMGELKRLGDPAAVRGRVILAHLGSGASLAAVRDGGCIDTSMGFTPAAGLVMGTRSGDLDPGLMSYLARTESMTAAQFQTMVNHESGLIGISETSSDIRDLLQAESADVRAREAIDVFCYQAKKWIGAFAAALGGVDTLVFAGGIGENAAAVRRRICEGLEFIGVEIDAALNEQHAARISNGAVAVRIIRTDEESVIAEMTARLLDLDLEQGVGA
ncbi:MAG: propionate kinase [Gammaproteobacteria bacterium]|jgi:acetate kinase|nr:propionate kinase [Gammaproteobacteria bacterium]